MAPSASTIPDHLTEMQATFGAGSTSSPFGVGSVRENESYSVDARNSSNNQDSYIVDWEDRDSEDPQNWALAKKLSFTVVGCSMIFSVAFASSIFGSATSVTAAQFNVSDEVMSLSVALYIAGYAIGPLFFAPFSEIVGHAIPLSMALLGCAVFQIPLSLAQNVQTILISRFLNGAIGSGVLAVGSGMMAELWNPVSRAVAIGFNATMMNMGSTVGPIAGSFIVQRYGWRWTGWATLIICGCVGFAALFAIRETSRKRILVLRARRIRKKTNNNAYHARSEMEHLSLGVLAQKYFTIPLHMIVQEPILIILTVYLTLVYGTLYLSYQLFPFAFKKRGWSASIASLPFISVTLGVLAAWGTFSLFTLTWYKRQLKAKGTTSPEDRLPPMILAACILPAALLWFGWSMEAHWAAQVISCFFVGYSLQLIFMSGVVYLVDVYMPRANSAISIHVVVRSLVSASFPLWSTPMYEGLGVQWSATVLAILAAVMLPSPILFRVYGRTIRTWSRFCDPGI
ncbi:major facilitator superfamily domain-containing protein [Aspergillus ambiguus]|uniref:major facilitator superfamily domain-containing protein n=1 Tax=Aspergillus ambiguus TaxID=176160 RepID=UPI003CCE1E8D